MCKQTIERYKLCGCVRYVHLLEQCLDWHLVEHKLQVVECFIGYGCPYHLIHPEYFIPYDSNHGRKSEPPLSTTGAPSYETSSIDALPREGSIFRDSLGADAKSEGELTPPDRAAVSKQLSTAHESRNLGHYTPLDESPPYEHPEQETSQRGRSHASEDRPEPAKSRNYADSMRERALRVSETIRHIRSISLASTTSYGLATNTIYPSRPFKDAAPGKIPSPFTYSGKLFARTLFQGLKRHDRLITILKEFYDLGKYPVHQIETRMKLVFELLSTCLVKEASSFEEKRAAARVGAYAPMLASWLVSDSFELDKGEFEGRKPATTTSDWPDSLNYDKIATASLQLMTKGSRDLTAKFKPLAEKEIPYLPLMVVFVVRSRSMMELCESLLVLTWQDLDAMWRKELGTPITYAAKQPTKSCIAMNQDPILPNAIDRTKIALERYTGQEWDWWPFAAPQRELISDKARLSWRNVCV